MTEESDGKRTQKGELARQRLLQSALHLFGSKGYEETTMREIAAAAGYSPGLTYRYFTSKEELVLVLYQNLSEELDEYARDLPPASLPERFHMAVAKHLELMVPHREALGTLFGTALNPRSQVGVFSESTLDIRRQCRSTYLGIIQGAKDAPRESQREDLANVLYGAHLAIVLFWLIDQSDTAWRTRLLLAFLRDMLKLIQPILWLPPVSQALTRLADILGPLLADDRRKATLPPQGQDAFRDRYLEEDVSRRGKALSPPKVSDTTKSAGTEPCPYDNQILTPERGQDEEGFQRHKPISSSL